MLRPLTSAYCPVPLASALQSVAVTVMLLASSLVWYRCRPAFARNSSPVCHLPRHCDVSQRPGRCPGAPARCGARSGRPGHRCTRRRRRARGPGYPGVPACRQGTFRRYGQARPVRWADPPPDRAWCAVAMNVEASTVIDRPLTEVFGYVSDFENHPKWERNFQAVRLLSAGDGVGTTYECVFKLPGQRVTATLEITTGCAAAAILLIVALVVPGQLGLGDVALTG